MEGRRVRIAFSNPMTHNNDEGVERAFPLRPESVSAARSFVLEAAPTTREDSRSRLSAVVSELSTNAILHAKTPFKVRVSGRPSRIRVAVIDESSAAPVRREYFASQPSGRGLAIVESLSDRWGIAEEGRGKAVWFEIDEGSDSVASL